MHSDNCDDKVILQLDWRVSDETSKKRDFSKELKIIKSNNIDTFRTSEPLNVPTHIDACHLTGRSVSLTSRFEVADEYMLG